VPVAKLLGQGLDVMGLGPEKSRGMYQPFKFCKGSLRQGRRAGEAGKKSGSDEVYCCVRTLSGQYCCDEELERIRIIQEGLVIRVEGPEDSQDFGKPCFLGRRGFRIHAIILPELLLFDSRTGKLLSLMAYC
jgi:hypothetical protein